jgi:hypothetical protein
MNPNITTFLLLIAIAVQAVFGGLQNTVSICLGGGHQHEVVEVVEHCDFECSHHSSWPAPITNETDIDNCDCTDIEFSLISLLSTPRDNDDSSAELALAFLTFPIPLVIENNLPIDRFITIDDYPGAAKQLQLVVVRTTRLLV